MDPQYQQQQQQHLQQGMGMNIPSNMYHQLLPMLQQTNQRGGGGLNPQLYQYMNMIPDMNMSNMNGMNGTGFASNLASQFTQQVENVVPSGSSG